VAPKIYKKSLAVAEGPLNGLCKLKFCNLMCV